MLPVLVMTWLSSSSCFISDTHSAMAADAFPVPGDVRPKCTCYPKSFLVFCMSSTERCDYQFRIGF